MRTFVLVPTCLAIVTVLSGCGDDDGPTGIVDGGANDAAVASPDAVASGPDATPDVDAAPDAGAPDAVVPDAEPNPDATADAGPQPDPTICDQLGLPAQPFDEGPGGVLYGELAADFTVNLLDGTPWNLRDEWTGCESYVFLNYIPTTDQSSVKIEDRMWGSDVYALLTDAPLNAHFFFTSLEPSAAARTARVQAMRDRIEAEAQLLIRDEAERARQLARFHYVTDDPRAGTGSVGVFLNDFLAYLPNSFVSIGGDRPDQPASLPFIFAIDRHQEWDPGGSLFPIVGSTIPTLDMAAYVPMFFNHRAAIRDAQAVEQGVETIVLRDERITERIFEVEAELPEGAALETYDTLEFDVTVNCTFRNLFACSEWDRIARIEVCPSGQCTCPPDTPDCSNGDLRREVVRWITPYWRNGWRRWVMDASDVMSLLGDGGTTRFRVEMGPSWERPTEREVRIAVRLSNQNRADRSRGAELAYRGGNFNATYNDREPYRFTPPATARRVELVAIISGHGQDPQTNCAEWCDHNHTFSVNGEALPRIEPGPGTRSFRGCAERADEGVPPGQGGNWALQRSYWCPGLPVDRQVIDITDQVTLGEENTLDYAADLRGGDPGGGNIDLSAYVVWYE